MVVRRLGTGRPPRRCIQSMFITAKLNGLDPARWLTDTLKKKLPTCPRSQIDSLIPFANSTVN